MITILYHLFGKRDIQNATNIKYIYIYYTETGHHFQDIDLWLQACKLLYAKTVVEF